MPSSDAAYENPLSPGKHQRQRPVTAPSRAPRHAQGSYGSSDSSSRAVSKSHALQHHLEAALDPQYQHRQHRQSATLPYSRPGAQPPTQSSRASDASGTRRSASAQPQRPGGDQHLARHQAHQAQKQQSHGPESPRFKARGVNPDFTPGQTLHSTLPSGYSPAAHPSQQQQQGAGAAKGAQDSFRAAPIFGLGNRYGGAATWAFKPEDYTWRSMTQAEKERAVEEAYHSGAANPFLFKTGGGGAGGTASMEDEPHKDPLLRFVTATRGTVTKEDLGQHRGPLVGFKAVPGAPDSRLVGGEWRWMPKAATKPPRTRLWTEYFGPVGGSSYVGSYYGKQYDLDGRAAYIVY